VPRHTVHVIAGEFVPLRRLVHVRGYDALRHNADLSEKFAAARTGRGQHQTAYGQGDYVTLGYYLNRKVMRPLVRS
jgi:hypothetical protein